MSAQVSVSSFLDTILPASACTACVRKNHFMTLTLCVPPLFKRAGPVGLGDVLHQKASRGSSSLLPEEAKHKRAWTG